MNLIGNKNQFGDDFMTHEQYEQAAQFWNKKEQIQMPEKSLKQAIEKYILENNTCALAYTC